MADIPEDVILPEDHPHCVICGNPIMGEADARLMAAAPDLYSALVSLKQAYSNKHSPQHRAVCLNEARAAIAKAEGK